MGILVPKETILSHSLQNLPSIESTTKFLEHPEQLIVNFKANSKLLKDLSRSALIYPRNMFFRKKYFGSFAYEKLKVQKWKN